MERNTSLDPETLAHQFYFRHGDYLEAEAPVDGWIASQVIPGFRVRPGWLDPANLPPVADCLAACLASIPAA